WIGYSDGRFCAVHLAARTPTGKTTCGKAYREDGAAGARAVLQIVPVPNTDLLAVANEDTLSFWRADGAELVEWYDGCGFFCRLQGLPGGGLLRFVGRAQIDLFRVGPVDAETLRRARRLGDVM